MTGRTMPAPQRPRRVARARHVPIGRLVLRDGATCFGTMPRTLGLVADGGRTYLWIGGGTGAACFGTLTGPKTLRAFARAILREVGRLTRPGGPAAPPGPSDGQRLAAAARCVARARKQGAEEMRERCAQLAERPRGIDMSATWQNQADSTGKRIAAAIRALDAGDSAARRG